MLQLKLPDFLTTTATFTEAVNGLDYDFEVKFTLFGEILEVENYFLILPKHAQMLMTGPGGEKVLEHLELITQLLPYAIPLCVMGILKEKKWQKITEAAEKLKEQNPMISLGDRKEYIQNKWVRTAWRAWEKNVPLLKQLATLLNTNNKNYLQTLRRLPHEKNDLVTPVLPILVQMLDSLHEKRFLYNAMKLHPHPETYTLLKHYLQSEVLVHSHPHILKGLQPYQSDEHRQLLINHYQKYSPLNAEASGNLATALKHYPDKEVKTILFSILTNKHQVAAYRAYESLVAFGVPKTTISDKVWAVFKERPSIGHISACFNIFSRFKSANLVPSVDEMIDVLIWAKGNLNITYSIVGFVEKYASPKDFKRLESLFNHENVNVRKGAVIQFSFTGKKKHIPMLLKMISKENQNINKDILNTLRNILNRVPYPSAPSRLMEIAQTYKDILITIYALDALDAALKKTPDEKVLPELLEFSHHQHQNIRKTAVKGLAAFNTKREVRERLEYLNKNDVAEVKNMANYSLNYIKPIPKPNVLSNKNAKSYRQYESKKQEEGISGWKVFLWLLLFLLAVLRIFAIMNR